MIDSKSVKSGKETGERKAKRTDLVIVEGTGSSIFIPKGKRKTVHRVLGEKLIADGKATLKGDVKGSELKTRKN